MKSNVNDQPIVSNVKYVVVAFLSMAIGGVGYWYYDQQQFSAAKLPQTADLAVEFVADRAEGRSDGRLLEFAKEVATSRSVDFIRDLVDALIRNPKSPDGQKLAVFLAREGAAVHNDAVLVNRAGLEFWLGRFVPKDLAQAQAELERDVVSKVPISQYYLAEVLLDQDNPLGDKERAIERLRFASANGVEAAQKKLIDVGASD